MRPIRLDAISREQLCELDRLYQTTHNARVRNRALIVLLCAKRHMVAAEIASIVRQSEQTVRRWLASYEAEGTEGLSDAPRSGAPPKVTPGYQESLLELVRRRPRTLGLPFSMWNGLRLADYLAEQTGFRMSEPNIHRMLRHSGMGLSRSQHTIANPDSDYALKK
ncbi:MAG: helix-turn-helix domain-containing protein [Oxalobacteraceae bacterium]|nr:MAG: helix-turn-helix domain-containing protein [Oxalobacteraceae bacterium]